MKKRKLFAVLIVFAATVSIAVTLIVNKRKIDAANRVIDRTLTPVSITVQKVISAEINSRMGFPAVLRPFEEASIYAQMPGIIVSLNIDQGSFVKKGQKVGAIDTRLASINLQSAELNNSKLKDDYQRAEDLYKGNAANEVCVTAARYSLDNNSLQIDQIKQQIANADIVAPVSGIISDKRLKMFEYASTGVPIATVVNISRLKATVFVNEFDVYQLKNGQNARITSSVFPGRTFKGNICFISPKGDENHNYQVDVVMDNCSDAQFKAGTNVNVTFDFDAGVNVLMIPKPALVQDKTEQCVYVVKNGVAELRTVKTGIENGDNIQVVSGLKLGELTITSGQINLRDGSKVRIVKE